MPRTSASSLVRSQLDAGDRRAARYVDLQLDWVRYGSREPIARFGGLWDRQAKDYAGDAPSSRVLEVHAQQIAAIELFDAWLAGHLTTGASNAGVRKIIEGDLELDADAIAAIGLSELFLTGGRRSGKTTIMMGILASYAIAVPGSIVWCVVPSEGFVVEPKEVTDAILPKAWYEYNGWPHFTYYLANGSQIVFRSAHHAGGLKKGKAAIVGCNELQQISEAAYRNARGATVDDGGFTIGAMNPPTTGDVGLWTADAIAQIEKGARPGGEHIFVDPMDNPHIDISKLLAMRAGMTEHDWQTQIRGRFLSLPDSVLYTWDAAENERAAPDFGRCTRDFLAAHEGDGRELDTIVVVDVQSFPWIACGIAQVYRDPRAPHDPKAGLLWLTGEIALSQADEEDTCDELKRRGINGDRTLVIMDASCKWFQMERDEMRQKPNYRGAGSMDIFRGHGFRHVVPPDRNMKGNPSIFERVRATNSMIKSADDVRGLYIDAAKCPNATASAKKWRLKRGKPSRTAQEAHFGDVLGYLVWRFFPRRGSADQLLSEALPRKRVEGFDELDEREEAGPGRRGTSGAG